MRFIHTYMISFLQVHAEIVSGFACKQSKSAFPFMIDTTACAEIFRCHLKMHSASEVRSRTAKLASEINDPSSFAQPSWPVDLTSMYTHLFSGREGRNVDMILFGLFLFLYHCD